MSDYDVLETTEDGRHRVILMQDEDCSSPIDTDAWLTSLIVLGWDRGGDYYGAGEVIHDPKNRAETLRHFVTRYWGSEKDAGIEMFKRYMRLMQGIEVREVNLVRGYRAEDTALAWVEPSEVERQGGGYTAGIDAGIDIEVGEYNRWAEGDCWGYQVQELGVEERVFYPADTSKEVTRSKGVETWRDTDESCWGFIGREYAEQEAHDALSHVVMIEA